MMKLEATKWVTNKVPGKINFVGIWLIPLWQVDQPWIHWIRFYAGFKLSWWYSKLRYYYQDIVDITGETVVEISMGDPQSLNSLKGSASVKITFWINLRTFDLRSKQITVWFQMSLLSGYSLDYDKYHITYPMLVLKRVL